ncbi:MAG TPA: NHL repeat-containing protein [Verrucomicrobiae bacterium]|jgi:hypothetical protein
MKTRPKKIGFGVGLVLASVSLSFFSLPALAQSNDVDAYTWTTFAGAQTSENTDGVGSDARFSGPTGVAPDANGNVYVADSGNGTIRVITPAGVVSTIAGLAGNFGSADGIGSTARFDHPAGLAVDLNNNIFVTDQSDDTIRKITPVGTNWIVSTIAGLPGTSGTNDGSDNEARFDNPQDLVVDGAGNLFVADTYSCTIRKIVASGTNWVVTTIAGLGGIEGNADGTNSNARFNDPSGVAVDANGNIYVADQFNGLIRKIAPVGTNWVVTTLAGFTSAGNSRLLDVPYSVTVDSATNLFVGGNASIQKITLVGATWTVSIVAGNLNVSGSTDGVGTNALFDALTGIAVDNAGNLYVADTDNSTIREVSPAEAVRTLAGAASGSIGSTDGTGSAARFKYPSSVAMDKSGNIYVADSQNDTVRQVTPAGSVFTLAGLAGNSGSLNGVAGNARFYDPTGIATDPHGNIYVADTLNNTIRRITPAGVVSSIAGSAGNSGSFDGTNDSAWFYRPAGIAADTNGNLYVADTDNNTIRKITPVGTNWVVNTIAGLAGYFGSTDGTNTIARFNSPRGLTVDLLGNIFVADTFNNTIREITPVGTNWVVSTISGQAENSGNADGTGTNALFSEPFGIAVDDADNLYVGDSDNSEIRRIAPIGTTWVTTTIGGLNTGNADGAGSAAQFDFPEGIAVDTNGDLYVADNGNSSIRKGVFTAYSEARQVIVGASGTNGALSVTLLPPEAGGQWRFGWETGWRDSGTIASNLVAGNYPLQFRNRPGYLAVQTNFIVVIPPDTTTYVTNQYYPTLNDQSTNSVGTLTVFLTPGVLSGTGWRILGESAWRASGSTATGLVPNVYDIQFEPVSGYATPVSEPVQVYAGVPTSISAGYLLAASPPQNVLLPIPVPTGEIGDVADYPFGFNGQLQSDVGYGSGVAVQPNVVLTAAHLVFNDQTFGYVSQVFWYFQQESGISALQPQAARGWYVLSGYASQRTNDLLGGLGVDQSSPQSRNLDVAALYFLSPVAGGGYNGYLPSDQSPNPWLSGNSSKMLVGYPVDGSEFGDASIVPGEMYQTQPQPYSLSLATDPVSDQQVYTANWFLSYPGASGGPVYVQYNGYYYPAGVYLGTLYNGVTPYASLVRAIDSTVVNLITNAEVLGDNNTNHTGGGVITVIPNQAISASTPGYLQFVLGPPGALAAGAAWKLSGDSAYSTATNYIRAVTSTNAVGVQFKPLSGWNLPANNQSVSVLPNQITSYSASYTVIDPVLVASGTAGLGITGTTGTVYVIQSRSSLTSGSWVNVSTNTITSSGINLILSNSLTNGATVFYRAMWLP